MLLEAFRSPKPDNRICRDTHWMVTGTSFVHCNHFSIPGLYKIFDDGIDRAHEVELPALTLWLGHRDSLYAASLCVVFLGDGCANTA
jgi:hypothetical protein